MSPTPLGRVGQGHYVKKRDPFGRVQEKQKGERFDFTNPFSLSGPVGMNGTNHRNDVAKVEGLLGIDGAHDIKKTDGPTGYFGTSLDGSVKKFQKRHTLKPDGLLNPRGETIRALQGKTVSKFTKMADNGDGGAPDPGDKPGDGPGGKPAPEPKPPAGDGGDDDKDGDDSSGWFDDLIDAIDSAMEPNVESPLTGIR